MLKDLEAAWAVTMLKAVSSGGDTEAKAEVRTRAAAGGVATATRTGVYTINRRRFRVRMAGVMIQAPQLSTTVQEKTRECLPAGVLTQFFLCPP